MTRYFPTYGYGTPPHRETTKIGQGGYTTWYGDITTNPNPYTDHPFSDRSFINIGTNSKNEIDYPFVRFQTHAIENRAMGIYGNGGENATNGWYSSLVLAFGSQQNLVSDIRLQMYGTEWQNHPIPGYSLLSAGAFDYGTDPAGTGQSAVTQWVSHDAAFPGGTINHVASTHYLWDSRGYSDPYVQKLTVYGDPHNIVQVGTPADNVALSVYGVLTKSSGTFDIEHPTVQGRRLRHSFIEGPQADLIYRGTAELGAAPMVIDMDTEFDMTPGTWEALNCTPWSMVSASGKVVEWEFAGSTLTITGDEGTTCMWMVIGERHDPHMKGPECDMADVHGRVIVEYDEPEPLPVDVPPPE